MNKTKNDPVGKYTVCFCDMKRTVLVGWGVCLYSNICAVIGLVVTTIALLVINEVYLVIYPTLLLIILAFLTLYRARQITSQAIKAGHTLQCSKKIAYNEALHSTLWSPFDIDASPTAQDSRGDYATTIIITSFIALLIDWIFLIDFAYSDTPRPTAYLIAFVCIIGLSCYLLYKHRPLSWTMKTAITVTVIFTAVSMLLYTLDLLTSL